ncbi:MAG: PKD domain-containing protein, partial [Methanospirillum sp.]
MRAFYGVLVLLLLCVAVQAVVGEEYVYVTQWGSVGTNEGQFQGMSGIAVDTSGRVYVADWSGIQRFTSTGEFVTRGNNFHWGSYDVDADSQNYVYTAELRENEFLGVAKYDLNGNQLQQWGDPPAYPMGVAVDTAGNIYLLSMWYTSSHREAHVSVYAPTGELLREWGSSDDIPIIDTITNDGHMNNPLGIALDTAGNVYIADTENNRIQKFTSTGTFIAKWGANGGNGTTGSGDGEFSGPSGITVDRHGDIYVADTGNHRIQKFRPDGTFVAKWGTHGSGNGQFDHPDDVDVDPAGNVYVADVWNNRVQKFAPILEPDFSATPKLGNAPLTVQFNDTTPNGQPLSWSWDFGDGGHSSLTNPSHTYTEPGIYDVALTVTNAVSGSRTRARDHYIAVGHPLIANFTASPRIGYAPLSVQFSDATTGDPTGWTWSFGDGGSSTAQNPLHAYANPGVYSVTLVASKALGTNTTTRYNCVYALPLTGPFTIQAEDYDEGGEGVAYHDTTPGNQGSAYRNDSVDIEPFGVGSVGYVIAQIRNGEWTRYTIPSAAAEDHD